MMDDVLFKFNEFGLFYGSNFDFFCLNDELYYKRKNNPFFLTKNQNLKKNNSYSVSGLKKVGGNLYVS